VEREVEGRVSWCKPTETVWERALKVEDNKVVEGVWVWLEDGRRRKAEMVERWARLPKV